jgi:elongator complex protein 2
MNKITPEYLAAGANRHPSAADWDESGLLAYGTDRNIALWFPSVSFHRSYCEAILYGNGPGATVDSQIRC